MIVVGKLEFWWVYVLEFQVFHPTLGACIIFWNSPRELSLMTEEDEERAEAMVRMLPWLLGQQIPDGEAIQETALGGMEKAFEGFFSGPDVGIIATF